MLSKKSFSSFLFFVLSFGFSLCVYSQTQSLSFDGFYRNGNFVEILKITVVPTSGFGFGVCKNCQIAGVIQSIYFRIGRNPQNSNILDCFNESNVRIGVIARNQTQITLRLINANNQPVREIPFFLIRNLEDKLKYIGERLNLTLDININDLKNMKLRLKLFPNIKTNIYNTLTDLGNFAAQRLRYPNDARIKQSLKTKVDEFIEHIRTARGLNSKYELDEVNKNLRLVNEILSQRFLLSSLEFPKWTTSSANASSEVRVANLMQIINENERSLVDFITQAKNRLQGTGIELPRI